MADPKQTGPKAPSVGYNPKPNQITATHYQQVVKEKEELTQKQLDADCEFMWQYYNRLLLVVDKTLERASKANAIIERRSRKEQAEAKRAAAKSKETA